MVYLDITCNGFLYNMVRIIAGTLMDAGQGNYPPEQVGRILKSLERKNAGPPAVARGLTMMQVYYE